MSLLNVHCVLLKKNVDILILNRSHPCYLWWFMRIEIIYLHKTLYCGLKSIEIFRGNLCFRKIFYSFYDHFLYFRFVLHSYLTLILYLFFTYLIDSKHFTYMKIKLHFNVNTIPTRWQKYNIRWHQNINEITVTSNSQYSNLTNSTNQFQQQQKNTSCHRTYNII